MTLRKFRIEFDTKAAREFKKLYRNNPSIVSRLIKSIDSLITAPFKGKPLTGNKK